MYYGWYIVGTVFLSQFFIVGFFTYSFSLFVVPIQNAFDASRTEVMQCMTVAHLILLLGSPFVGLLVDRHLVRWLMVIGVAFFGGGLLLMPYTKSVWQFVLVFGIALGFANLLLGPVVTSTTIARWFDSARGRALGISAIGTSVGGLIMPPLIAYWLVVEDWSNTMRNLSFIILLTLMPLVVLVMRSKSAGAGSSNVFEKQSDAAQGELAALSNGDLIRDPSFWLIGVSSGLLFCANSALLANLTPYAVGLGVGEIAAARLIMIISITGVIGKIVFGMAADKINLRLSFWIAQFLVILALILFAISPSYSVMIVAAVLFGLALGGALPVWGAMLAVVFGVVSYGRVMGLINPLILLLVMPSFSISAFLYDITGGYGECFAVFAGIVAVAASLLVFLRMPASINIES